MSLTALLSDALGVQPPPTTYSFRLPNGAIDRGTASSPDVAEEYGRRVTNGAQPVSEGRSIGLVDSLAAAFNSAPAPAASPKASTSVPDSAPPAMFTPSGEKAKPSFPGMVVDAVEGFRGGKETALSLLTGMLAAPVAAAGGVVKGFTGGKYGTQQGAQEAKEYAGEILSSLTYSPKTEAGQDALGAIGQAVDSSKIAGLGPSEAMTLAGVGSRAATSPKGAPKAVQAPAGQFGSVGAAGVPEIEQARALLSKASPDLQAAAAPLFNSKEPVRINMQALTRHIEADSLPVPMRLTTGQATGDVSLLSNEQNLRGKHRQFADRFNEQNNKLVENLQAIKENAAPDVYAITKPEHGELIIDAYRTKDAALNAEIAKKYKALRDANAGDFPLDAKTFVRNADEALHKALLYDQVPSSLRSTLDRLASGGNGVGGGMTFENFESLRTNLARIQRSQADGNVKHAASIIRNALEDLPMPPGAEHLKPLADAARSAAKERFALIEADPAYKAVTRGTVSADKFIDKYIVAADLKNVETMKKNLSHDQVAQQTMAAGAMNHLREGAMPSGGTNFTQAGYNKGLDRLRPKLGVLFEPEQRQQVETLGNVARYTQEQPRGAFVNNSNTATALMAEGAKNAAEGAVNVAAKGVPVGTFGRKILEGRKQRKEINEALQTGGGILLKDVK